MLLIRFEHRISSEKYAFTEVLAAKEGKIFGIAVDHSEMYYILSFDKDSCLSRVLYACKYTLKDLAFNEKYALIMFKVDDNLMIFKDIKTGVICLANETKATGLFSPDSEVVGISKKEENKLLFRLYRSVNVGDGLASKTFIINSKISIAKLFWSHLGLFIGLVIENRIKIFSIIMLLSVYDDEEKANPLQVELTPDDACVTILHQNELKIISISGRSTLAKIDLTNSPTMFRWGTTFKILCICGRSVLQLEA
jgi:hypothetical protein